MKYEIKRCDNGNVIFTHECDSWKICVEAAIMSGVDLYGVDLSGANLSGANLSRANLSGANLSGVDLYGADLSGANMSGANMSRANMSGANMSRANLSGANMSGADMSGANMSRANMSGADLSGANMSRANMSRANMSGANMSRANLKEIKNAALSLAQTHITPQEGSFVGWKKLRNGVIAKIVITHDARRINAVGSRKCRASKVFVHEMYSPDGAIFTGVGIGQYDSKTTYETGKETIPDSFDDSITDECSHGIHFFLTREEAEAY